MGKTSAIAFHVDRRAKAHPRISRWLMSVPLMIGTMIGASPALAAGDTTGTISELSIYTSTHLVNIKLNVPPSTPSSCVTTTVYAGVLDVSTSAGQAQYAALLTAQANNANVRIIGHDTCVLETGIEDVSVVRFPE